MFFHKFFTRKNEREKAKAAKVGKRKGEGDSDSESDSEDSAGEQSNASSDAGDAEFPRDSGEDPDSGLEEAEIWKAMKASLPKVAGDEDLLEESDDDDIPSDLDDGDDEGDDSSLGDSDASNVEDEDDALSFAEASDNEDLVPLDDMPAGLIDFEGSDAGSNAEDAADEEEWGGINDGKKRKRAGDTRGARRKKLRALPTFASYEDYARMIEEAPEDDI
jgi:ribosome biogenesis protein MAK21